MKINLSERLQAIANLVIPNEVCADIGTDHGYVPAYLYSEGICPRVILSDVSIGPLEIAKKNILEFSLEIDDFRLGSGISVLKNGEASTVIIAGMGGELIESILSDDLRKAHSFKKIILQPRTRCDELRVWLSMNGFKINDYVLAMENGRICEIFSVVNGESKKENPVISDSLIEGSESLFNDFLESKITQRKKIISGLKMATSHEFNKINKQQSELDYLLSIKKHE